MLGQIKALSKKLKYITNPKLYETMLRLKMNDRNVNVIPIELKNIT